MPRSIIQLSQAELNEIERRHALGNGQRQIAKDLDVHPRTVRAAVERGLKAQEKSMRAPRQGTIDAVERGLQLMRERAMQLPAVGADIEEFVHQYGRVGDHGLAEALGSLLMQLETGDKLTVR